MQGDPFLEVHGPAIRLAWVKEKNLSITWVLFIGLFFMKGPQLLTDQKGKSTAAYRPERESTAAHNRKRIHSTEKLRATVLTDSAAEGGLYTLIIRSSASEDRKYLPAGSGSLKCIVHTLFGEQ